jgi:hypothetical protein
MKIFLRVEAKLQAFFASALDVSGQLHTLAALPSTEEPPGHIG